MAEWRAIPKWEGLYEISSDGQVRSLDRARTGNRPGQHGSRGRILAPVRRGGYLTVSLQNRGIEVAAGIHRLLMLTFRPHRESAVMDVCHINGQRADNRLENLRWDTRRGNLADMDRHGTKRRGELVYGARLNADVVRLIRQSAETTAALARQLGVSYTAVEFARKHITWKHVV